MHYKIPLEAWLFAALVVFTIVNPVASLDIASLLLIGFIILYRLLGDYSLVALLIIRPTIDIWRDNLITSTAGISINFNAALSIVLILWSIFFFTKEKQYWSKIPLKIPWLVFIIWCVASLFWTYDLTSTITETVKVINLAILFGVLFILRTKHQQQFSQNMVLALLASIFIPFLVAGYQFFTHTGMTIDNYANRIYGTLAHPNILATLALLVVIIMADVKIKSENFPLFKNKEKAWWSITLISLAIIALTYTRIAWIGVALFIIIMGLKYFRKPLFIFIGSVILLYTIFFPINKFLIYNFNVNLQANPLIARLTTRNEDADSIQWRADVASKVIPLWQKHPVIGYGYGAFAKVWDVNKTVSNIWDNTSEAHNDYLKIGFETGIIGLVFFLVIFTNLLYIAWKKRNLVFIASILVYLTLSLSDNMLHHTPVIWWMWAVWGVWSAES